ncbi:MAG: hypothetical protein ACRC10_04145 [Thermoguttaceae bacterium]
MIFRFCLNNFRLNNKSVLILGLVVLLNVPVVAQSPLDVRLDRNRRSDATNAATVNPVESASNRLSSSARRSEFNPSGQLRKNLGNQPGNQAGQSPRTGPFSQSGQSSPLGQSGSVGTNSAIMQGRTNALTPRPAVPSRPRMDAGRTGRTASNSSNATSASSSATTPSWGGLQGGTFNRPTVQSSESSAPSTTSRIQNAPFESLQTGRQQQSVRSQFDKSWNPTTNVPNIRPTEVPRKDQSATRVGTQQRQIVRKPEISSTTTESIISTSLSASSSLTPTKAPELGKVAAERTSRDRNRESFGPTQSGERRDRTRPTTDNAANDPSTQNFGKPRPAPSDSGTLGSGAPGLSTPGSRRPSSTTTDLTGLGTGSRPLSGNRPGGIRFDGNQSEGTLGESSPTRPTLQGNRPNSRPTPNTSSGFTQNLTLESGQTTTPTRPNPRPGLSSETSGSGNSFNRRPGSTTNATPTTLDSGLGTDSGTSASPTTRDSLRRQLEEARGRLGTPNRDEAGQQSSGATNRGHWGNRDRGDRDVSTGTGTTTNSGSETGIGTNLGPNSGTVETGRPNRRPKPNTEGEISNTGPSGTRPKPGVAEPGEPGIVDETGNGTNLGPNSGTVETGRPNRRPKPNTEGEISDTGLSGTRPKPGEPGIIDETGNGTNSGPNSGTVETGRPNRRPKPNTEGDISDTGPSGTRPKPGVAEPGEPGIVENPGVPAPPVPDTQPLAPTRPGMRPDSNMSHHPGFRPPPPPRPPVQPTVVVNVQRNFRGYHSYWTSDWYHRFDRHHHPYHYWRPVVVIDPVRWWTTPSWGTTWSWFHGYAPYYHRPHQHASIFVNVEPTPVYYNYGDNIEYRGDMVYINGVPYVSAEKYYEQSLELAKRGAETGVVRIDLENGQPLAVSTQPALLSDDSSGPNNSTTPSEDWMPLGSFAILNSADSADVRDVLQLAMNRGGILRGNFYDEANDELLPVEGAIDQETQRVAFQIGDRKDQVYECGLWNLTQESLAVLVHDGAEKTQTLNLVRLTETQPK